MTVIKLNDISADIFGRKTVVALGNFDGVHTAHTALLKKTCELAKELDAIPTVFTFSQEKGSLIPGKGVCAVIPESEKLALIKETGIECVCLAEFDELREYSPKEFVSKVLIGALFCKMAVCGFNYRFGKGGVGDHDALTDLMGGNAFVMPPVMIEDMPVSSSKIRASLESGDVVMAQKMLGRHYYVRFPVMHGKELGRKLGAPTINQNFPSGVVVPASGVYACTAEVDGKLYPAVTNVGRRPTVENDGNINAETHIIGYDGMLYGEHIKVSFYKRLRKEKKFESVCALKEGIASDIENANAYFKEIGMIK